MPIPQPEDGETQNDFIGRCMANDVMVSEYPDEDQRSAVCFREWSEGKSAQNVTLGGKPSRVLTKAAMGVNNTVIDTEARTVSVVLSTDALDRDREVVLPKGLGFKDFRKNPVVLWMHDGDKVIGRSVGETKEQGRVVAKTQFAETAFAEEIFQLVAQGILKGVSIGMDWLTIKFRDPTPRDLKGRPDWAGVERIIEKANILEYSFVSIPANPEALVMAQRKGLIRLSEPFFEQAKGPSIRRTGIRRVSTGGIRRVSGPSPTDAIRTIRDRVDKRFGVART